MDMSTAILSLSENGQLEKIRRKWLNTRACRLSSSNDSDELQLSSFWGLFLICGIACFLALLFYFCSIVKDFKRYSPQQSQPESAQSGSTSRQIKRFLSFVDEKEDEFKLKLKRKRLEMLSRGGAEDQQTANRVLHTNEESGIYLEGHNVNATYFSSSN